VNHISPQSEQFKDFVAKGDASEFASMFVDWEKLWPPGELLAIRFNRRLRAQSLRLRLLLSQCCLNKRSTNRDIHTKTAV
jgi:hypothetical protein